MLRKPRFLILLSLSALVAVTAFFIAGARREARTSGSLDDLESAQSPLGGLFERASRVSRLKEQMGQLRRVWPAMNQFADAHQGLLPTNLVELRPYLPANLASLSDEHWEMPSGGLAARPLMQLNDAVLLQQKNVSPNHPKIVVYSDGHIEYKK
jgi:hypothetical protein